MTGVQTCALPICFPVTILTPSRFENLIGQSETEKQTQTFWLSDFSHLRAESAFRQREKKSKTWFTGGSETNNFCTNWKLSDWKLLLEWKFHRKVLTNIISTDRNIKIIALIYRLLFRDLWEKKRLFIFGQTLFVSWLKVHLDTELKIVLREKVYLIGRN